MQVAPEPQLCACTVLCVFVRLYVYSMYSWCVSVRCLNHSSPQAGQQLHRPPDARSSLRMEPPSGSKADLFILCLRSILLALYCPVLQLQLWFCGFFQLLHWIGIRSIREEVPQPYTLQQAPTL